MKTKIYTVSKILLWTIFGILIALILFLGLYVMIYKSAEKNDKIPPFTLYTVISKSMSPEINIYDVLILKKTDSSKLKVGDVITFSSPNNIFINTTITHRIQKITEENGVLKFTTKGDANQNKDSVMVTGEDIVGKVIFVIPKLGRIQFFLADNGGWIIGILIPAMAVLIYDIVKVVEILILKKKSKETNYDL